MSGRDGHVGDFTQMLDRARSGDDAAVREVLACVYTQLRSIAGKYMRGERRDHTLQATALVHEAYLRLMGTDEIGFENSAHFFSTAAEAMRRILIEHARKKSRHKRGGGRKRISLDIANLADAEHAEEILAFDAAFQRLEEEMPEVADIVRMRFFAGLTIPQTARALGISPRTVNRQWSFARAWIYRELEDQRPDE